jgi:iron complex outermembrane receptor protein
VATTAIEAEVSGGFAVGSWSHEHANGASTTAQLAFDSTDRSSPHFGEKRRTHALDVQHQRNYGRHDLVLGAEYRGNAFDIVSSPHIQMPFTSASYSSVSAFVQDQFALVPDRLKLTLGSKIEHNELSNREYDVMPTARLLWQIDSETSFWAAVTRAVRTPSYADLGARVVDVDPVVPPGTGSNPFPLPLRFAAVGSPDFHSEELLAYEVGIRGRFGESTSYDLSVYSMEYDNLRAYSPAGAFCNPSHQRVATNPACLFASDSVITEISFNNEGWGTVRGFELSVHWDLSERWRIRTSYAHADETQKVSPPSIPSSRASGPRNQAAFRSEWSLGTSLALATWLRYVDEIAAVGIADYWQANVQLSWRVNDQWQLAVGGNNLLDSANLEYLSELNDTLPTEIERRLFLRAEWRF